MDLFILFRFLYFVFYVFIYNYECLIRVRKLLIKFMRTSPGFLLQVLLQEAFLHGSRNACINECLLLSNMMLDLFSKILQ